MRKQPERWHRREGPESHPIHLPQLNHSWYLLPKFVCHFFLEHASIQRILQGPQRWALEDGGGLCLDKASPCLPSPRPCSAGISQSSMEFRWILWASHSKQTNREEKHPSGALLSSQNPISAQPKEAELLFNPLWEGPLGLI